MIGQGSMATTTSSAPAAVNRQHIPAWKRIGLRLKYAKDNDDDENPKPAKPQPDVNGARPTSDVRLSHEADKIQSGGTSSTKKRKASTELSREIRGQPKSVPLVTVQPKHLYGKFKSSSNYTEPQVVGPSPKHTVFATES